MLNQSVLWFSGLSLRLPIKDSIRGVFMNQKLLNGHMVKRTLEDQLFDRKYFVWKSQLRRSCACFGPRLSNYYVAQLTYQQKAENRAYHFPDNVLRQSCVKRSYFFNFYGYKKESLAFIL